jgi:hypothetical protein
MQGCSAGRHWHLKRRSGRSSSSIVCGMAQWAQIGSTASHCCRKIDTDGANFELVCANFGVCFGQIVCRVFGARWARAGGFFFKNGAYMGACFLRGFGEQVIAQIASRALFVITTY